MRIWQIWEIWGSPTSWLDAVFRETRLVFELDDDNLHKDGEEKGKGSELSLRPYRRLFIR